MYKGGRNIFYMLSLEIRNMQSAKSVIIIKLTMLPESSPLHRMFNGFSFISIN